MEEGDKRVKHRFAPWRTSIDHRVIFSLTLIIITCLVSVVVLTGMILFNLPEKDHGERTLNLGAIMGGLGQLAATGLGAITGYFSANAVHKNKHDSKEIGTSEEEEGE